MMRCNEIEEENQQLEDRVLLEMTLNISTYPFRGRFLFSEGPQAPPEFQGDYYEANNATLSPLEVVRH